MSNLLKKEKGFTLIEIVLVLAIAGLLLVIVFLAVSGAQKSRRDSQRKNDNARLVAQIEQYASNNNGSYASLTGPMLQAGGAYAPNNFNDPSTGSTYTINVAHGTSTPASCSGPGTVNVAISGRSVFSKMCLEQGEQQLSNQ